MSLQCHYDRRDSEGAILTWQAQNGLNIEQCAGAIGKDIDVIYECLGIDMTVPVAEIVPEPSIILCTSEISCIFCHGSDSLCTLRRSQKPQMVNLLLSNYSWVKADLFIGHCVTCKADYYPDKVIYLNGLQRVERLDREAVYLRVSKHRVWMHRSVAVAQERSSKQQGDGKILYHFIQFGSHSGPEFYPFFKYIREELGCNGGVLKNSMEHACMNCTHKKRYRDDLVAEGANLDGEVDELAGDLGGPASDGPVDLEPPEDEAAQTLARRPIQNQEPPEGAPRGYTRLAVWTERQLHIGNPLMNYKDGRFCIDHILLRNICGIIPCGRPTTQGSLTCNNPAHKDWHRQYQSRFTHLSFPGVQRVIRRQQETAGEGRDPAAHGNFRVQLPDLEGVQGNEVAHTFRAGKTYCLQTVQWACGMPIGWGKCYRSESAPQLLSILNNIWEDSEEYKPSFIAYDDACDLLRHIVTQDPADHWFKTTKFIVDAWHYIGHRATDVLCRLWCNPSPKNGSQPDLIRIAEDINGVKHTSRAFNTETAEQFNAWLDGFEAQLRQMTDVNYDFVIHCLMMLYTEIMEKRIREKKQELDDDFWDEVALGAQE
ncbi:hypothetical protein C8J56DRAFT_890692 [Mycena floridula]|nr:hypothetical protein C8J56DRAFT_890692 [Mycena floridula]